MSDLDNLAVIDRYIDTLREIEDYCKKHRCGTAQTVLAIIDKYWPEPTEMPV